MKGQEMAVTVKHTPGPWQIEGRYDIELGSLYLSTMHPMPIFELQPLVGNRDEHMANALLIAAAPDLLAEAKRAAEVMERHIYPKPDVGPDHPYSVLQALLAVIAKAEGRS